MSKRTVCLDFDGVVHSYASGWKGAACIPDPPVCGIKEAIDELRNNGYYIVICSTRAKSEEGLVAIREWLNRMGIAVDDVTADKPPAICYIDDRAICFDGHPETLARKIRDFKPWYK